MPQVAPFSTFYQLCPKTLWKEPFPVKKKIYRNLESGEDSRKLEAESISTVLFLFQSNSQLLFPRRASDGWVWGIGLIVASHRVHPSWPQSTWMFLREPFSLHVPVNWSGWIGRGNWENLLLVSLTGELKTSQLVLYHWAMGAKTVSSPTLQLVPPRT